MERQQHTESRPMLGILLDKAVKPRIRNQFMYKTVLALDEI